VPFPLSCRVPFEPFARLVPAVSCVCPRDVCVRPCETASLDLPSLGGLSCFLLPCRSVGASGLAPPPSPPTPARRTVRVMLPKPNQSHEEAQRNTALRQSEDEDPLDTPQTFLQSRGSFAPTPHDDSPPPPVVTDTQVIKAICIMLQGRSDAAAILISSADQLGVTSSDFQLGLDMHQFHLTGTLTGPDRAALGSAFATWRQFRESALHSLRLRQISTDFKARRSPGEPRVTKVLTWADRDAALRSEAESLSSGSSSVASSASAMVSKPVSLPFSTVAELPACLASHKEAPTITALLETRVDPTGVHATTLRV